LSLEHSMTDAVVIPFPVPVSAAGEQQRLRRALADLQLALQDQKRALSDWRFAIAELGIGVAALGQALEGYQGNLGDVEQKLGGLRAETAKMATWANGTQAALPPNPGG
jgi:hypothetical protein